MSERPDWFIAIKVPAGKLEETMNFAYQIGGELREFAPEHSEKIEELTKALPNGKPAAQITDETKAKKARPAGDGLLGTCKGFVLKALRRRPRTSRELRELATEQQVTWDLKGVDSRLAELKQKGWVHITPRGWDLTELGRQFSKAALVPNNHYKNKARVKDAITPVDPAAAGYKPRAPKLGNKNTQVDVVEEVLKGHYPNFVLLSQVRDEFVKKKLRHESASTALHFLKRKGRAVAGAEAATYKWVPPDQREARPQEETK